MKLLSIRLLLTLSLSLILLAMLFSASVLILLFMQNPTTLQQQNVLMHSTLANSKRWTDHSWQQTLDNSLAGMHMAMVLRNPGGQIIFHSSNYNNASSTLQEIVVTDGTHELATASLYDTLPAVLVTPRTTLVGLQVFMLILAAIGIFIGSTILKPMSAISQAARQVACNDLNFHFPVSHVREVEEMYRSFTKMKEALRDSLQRQAEVEQERRLLISAVAHDLRTPLFSLRGYLEGLATGLAGTPEKAAKYIAVCQTKAAALERLISELFTYTQLEYLEQAPLQEPLEIGELITHTLDSLQPQAQASTVRLVADGPSTPCIVHADSHLLTRVFENLLENALRYTPAGGSIRVSWRREHDSLAFTVTDTGPGFAPADLAHLFTPLYRGDPSRNHHTGGAGLGLSIAQRILRAHGGDLKAANAVSGGAVFSGTLSCKGTEISNAKASETHNLC